MSIVERERVEEVVAPREVTEADVLERAADLLEEFGWCQGDLAKHGGVRCFTGDKPDSFCIMGALRQGYADLTGDSRGFMSTMPWEPWRWLPGQSAVACWNDKAGRTKAEVVSALRTATQKARES